MVCGSCGTNNGNGANFCYSCGAAFERKHSANQICSSWQQNLQPAMEYSLPQQGFQSTMVNARPQRSRGVAAVLALFLGGFGAHRFYAGKTGSAVTMLVLMLLGILTSFIFIGLFLVMAMGIWATVDFFIIISGGMKDVDGNKI